MEQFNVIIYEDNGFRPYDVIPYFIERYKSTKPSKRPTDTMTLEDWLLTEAAYMFKARCQWEIILIDWPREARREKWDVYKQLRINWKTFVDVFARCINFKSKK